MLIVLFIFCFKQVLPVVCTSLVLGGDVQQETPNQICPTTQIQDHSYRLTMQVLDKCEENAVGNSLKRVHLQANITCNDGSPAGFYIRKSTSSKKWIVYLEGGWYCYDEVSCLKRWSRVRYLMSSEQWPPYRSGSGILSNNPEENPYWWNANHVFIPYCTSDIWSGRRTTRSHGSSFNFMGALIVKQVVKVLLRMGLRNANTFILAGSSAGGVGVMLHLEPVQRLLNRYGSKVKIKGITDSGWFTDKTFVSPNKLESITPVDAVKRGFSFWKSQIPHSCRLAYPRELWKCFIGYKIYPTLPVPLFVFQWLFDEVQLHAENLVTPITRPQWEHIHQMGDMLRDSFQNVTSIFAPSCISHTILTKRDWQHIKIDNVPLPHALHCWEKKMRKLQHQNAKNYNSIELETVLPSAFLNSSKIIKYQNKKTSNGRKRNGRRGNHQKKSTTCKHLKRNCKRTRELHASSIVHGEDNSCAYRLIERCSWPQCNHYCPKLQNPVTGEELDFLELLQSFGLDMTNVAAALGVDIHTLNNMSQKELINLLTQQVN